MKFYIAGDIPQVDAIEWFPGFNRYFVESYLSKRHECVILKYENDGWLKKFEVPNSEYSVRLNSNSVVIIEAKSMKAICFSTFFNLRVLFDCNKEFFHNHLIHLYSGHYNPNVVKSEWPSEVEVSPWYFRPLKWKPIRVKWIPKKKKLFFRGLRIEDSRLFIDILADMANSEIDAENNRVDPNLYFSQCSNAYACLSAPGIRDMCNRDIEFWINGIPMIRPVFTSSLLIDIPEDVYIPIHHDIKKGHNSLTGLPLNHFNLASQIVDKWNEIKDDINYLKIVSQNGKDFYHENLTPQIIADKTLNLISTQFDY